MSLYLQLGKYGDIINILPLLLQDWQRTGEKPKLIVASKYANLIEGVTYVEPIVYPGEFEDIEGALKWCQQQPTITQVIGAKETIITQVYGQNREIRLGMDSFQRESWNVAGRISDWKLNLPLEFNNRTPDREANLRTLVRAKPDRILLHLSGESSPFPYTTWLKDALQSAFGDSIQFSDISNIKAQRIYDMLGLIENCKAIICADSAILHLAYATWTPVVALIADKPTLWHGSAYRPNHIAHVRYSQLFQEFPKIVRAIKEIRQPGSRSSPLTGDDPRLIHTCCHGGLLGAATYRRGTVAEATWRAQYALGRWINAKIPDGALLRNSQTMLKDDRPCAFIKDVIRLAALHCRSEDIIVLTNADTCLSEDFTQKVLDMMREYPAIHGHRRDFERIDKPFRDSKIKAGALYPGTDLICMKRDWWFEHMAELPDMVLGAEAWDLIWREAVRQWDGAEIKDVIYHERHETHWEKNYTTPGNLHSRRLAAEWLRKYGKEELIYWK